MGFEGTTLWRVRQKVGIDLMLWPGASVMVERDDGRVLLGRRLDNGMWAIPGGGAEEGSSFADTAVTELREEVGLVAPPTCRPTPASHGPTTTSRRTPTATSPTTSGCGSSCAAGGRARRRRAGDG